MPPSYSTTNWQACNEALKRRGSLTVWFDPGMIGEAEPTGTRGRQPDDSGQEDQLGIAVEGPPDERNARKHGGPKRRVWRRIHLGIDEERLEIGAVEVIGNNVGDAPMLPELLDQIAPDQEIGTLTADGACDTRKYHDAIADRGAAAIMPPRRNDRPRKPATAGAQAGNEALRTIEVPGSGALGTVERLSPPKPRRDGNALRQTLGPTPRGARIRPSGGRVPNPDCRVQWLHRTWHFVHLRTTGTVLPRQDYQAGFDAPRRWAELRLPLAAFRASGGLLRRTRRPESLTSLAVVAYGRDHDAEIELREVEFY